MKSKKSSVTKKDAVIIGYDAAAVDWCSPSFFGCQICASATAANGVVTLTLSLKTPFGNISKSFSFSADINYTWQPFGRFKVTIEIAGLTENNGALSFNLGLKPCVDAPIIGWQCYDFSHHFVLPIPLEVEDMEQKFSDLLMVMHTTGAHTGGSPVTNMLQGDIYNKHAPGGFPTVPVVSCAVTCTGISPICLANQGHPTQDVKFPTVPVVSCAVTCTGISPICLANQGHPTQDVKFPTVPVVSCAVTCTGISPICLTK